MIFLPELEGKRGRFSDFLLFRYAPSGNEETTTSSKEKAGANFTAFSSFFSHSLLRRQTNDFISDLGKTGHAPFPKFRGFLEGVGTRGDWISLRSIVVRFLPQSSFREINSINFLHPKGCAIIEYALRMTYVRTHSQKNVCKASALWADRYKYHPGLDPARYRYEWAAQPKKRLCGISGPKNRNMDRRLVFFSP